jgi:hypothetical protein
MGSGFLVETAIRLDVEAGCEGNGRNFLADQTVSNRSAASRMIQTARFNFLCAPRAGTMELPRKWDGNAPSRSAR